MTDSFDRLFAGNVFGLQDRLVDPDGAHVFGDDLPVLSTSARAARLPVRGSSHTSHRRRLSLQRMSQTARSRRLVILLLAAAGIAASLPHSSTSGVSAFATRSTRPASLLKRLQSSPGKTIFLNVGCGACHTMAPAGTHGQVGPNLDVFEPPYSLVVSQITSGSGGMPAFGRRLSKAQVASLAKFVYAWTSRP